jgi:hypothetical protein
MDDDDLDALLDDVADELVAQKPGASSGGAGAGGGDSLLDEAAEDLLKEVVTHPPKKAREERGARSSPQKPAAGALKKVGPTAMPLHDDTIMCIAGAVTACPDSVNTTATQLDVPNTQCQHITASLQTHRSAGLFRAPTPQTYGRHRQVERSPLGDLLSSILPNAQSSKWLPVLEADGIAQARMRPPRPNSNAYR